MSKYTDAQYRKQQRLMSRIHSTYSQARIYHLSHSQILDRFAHMYTSMDWQKVNGYTRAFVRGAMYAMADAHYRVLKFGYVQENGQVRTTDELREEHGDDWHKYCNGENGTHFYSESKERARF